MKKTIQFFLISLFLFPNLFFAQTYLLEITSDTTWTKADSPIILPHTISGEQSIFIEGATLTIEEGVVIKGGSEDRITVGAGGKIIAAGSIQEPILFTSNNSIREPEQWGGILFAEYSGREDEPSVFDNVHFQYGSISTKEGVLSLANNVVGPVIVTNCTFYKNRVGITASFGEKINISNCRFTNNSNGGIVLKDAQRAVINNNYFSGNEFAFRSDENFPDSLNGNVFRSFSQKVYLPNIIRRNVNLSVAGYLENYNEKMPFTLGFNSTHPSTTIHDARLIINQGLTVIAQDFGAVKSSLIVDKSAQLVLEGTEELPIIFTCEDNNKSWGGIVNNGVQLEINFSHFENAANGAVILRNDGGADIINSSFSNNQVAVVADSNFESFGNSRGTISNCLINNNFSGININGGVSFNIRNCEVFDNNTGINIKGYSDVSIANSNIHSNQTNGIYSDDVQSLSIGECVIEYNMYGFFYETNNNTDSRTDIINTTIRRNEIGIDLDIINGTNMELAYCNLAENYSFAISNETSTVINAKNNWWGDPSGPLDESDNSADPTGLYNPDGLGSKVTDFVDYGLWLDFYVSDNPNIMIVKDVPNDQGRHVFVGWSTSGHDQTDSDLPIVKYSVWRKLPNDGETKSTKEYPSDIALSKKLLDEMDFNFLEFIGDVTPLPELDAYVYNAPTLADSNADGIFYSTFMIVAHTSDPQIYFKSEFRSGYSIDNISPGVPFGLTATQNPTSIHLFWNKNIEEDFAYYSVYKNDELLLTTIDTLFNDNEVENEKYQYKVTAVDINGNESDAAIVDIAVGVSDEHIPTEFALEQNYPNPFNPSTTINFSIPSQTKVKISVYNSIGEEVATLINREMNAGFQSIDFDASQLSSGLYFYKISAGDFVDVKKMMLLK